MVFVLLQAMPLNEDSATPVQEFYQDATVLITGGTGFLGKILVEKLLRSCPHINQIILLIRGKKDANCEERLDHIMEETVSFICLCIYRQNNFLSFLFMKMK